MHVFIHSREGRFWCDCSIIFRLWKPFIKKLSEILGKNSTFSSTLLPGIAKLYVAQIQLSVIIKYPYPNTQPGRKKV